MSRPFCSWRQASMPLVVGYRCLVRISTSASCGRSWTVCCCLPASRSWFTGWYQCFALSCAWRVAQSPVSCGQSPARWRRRQLVFITSCMACHSLVSHSHVGDSVLETVDSPCLLDQASRPSAFWSWLCPLSLHFRMLRHTVPGFYLMALVQAQWRLVTTSSNGEHPCHFALLCMYSFELYYSMTYTL